MQWAHDHPEEYAELARLPMHEQNAALRHAIGYDPDRVRDEADDDRHMDTVHVLDELAQAERDDYRREDEEMWGSDPLDEEAEIAELQRLSELDWGPDDDEA